MEKESRETGKIKKRMLVPYILAGGIGIVAVLLFFRTNALQRQLERKAQNQETLEQKAAEFKVLTSIDSLLVKGAYSTAIKRYGEDFEGNIGKEGGPIALRIALAHKMLELKNNAKDLENPMAVDSLDSIQTRISQRPTDFRQYDSLNFALEKAKVQLSRMRRQLKGKATGQYLRFKSRKGDMMHYVGHVRKGKANGSGIALLDTGSRYEGDWKNNERDGEGTFYWPDGEYYVGSYLRDRRNGQGSYYWPNGEKFSGGWLNDKRSGYGTFYGSDGTVVTSGIWKNDKLVDEEKK